MSSLRRRPREEGQAEVQKEGPKMTKDINPIYETIGGGTLQTPAIAPSPSFGVGGPGFVAIKNWRFGATIGTIKNQAAMNSEFQYHDQFNTYHNQNYGAKIVSPDAANALLGQPVEFINTGGLPARQFLDESLRMFLVPLNGATTLVPAQLNTGSGSFQAKFVLPQGGSLLGHDIIWETRVRYVIPPYFWFALWTSGNIWSGGAEMDLIESFGYDNGGGFTNFAGAAWHSNSVGGQDNVNYGNWWSGMQASGVHMPFDPTQYHIWQWLYRKDDTYTAYVDGIAVQSGTIHWTVGGKPGATPINMSFIFDGTWGSPTVWNDNYPLPAAAMAGKFFDIRYSRIYESF